MSDHRINQEVVEGARVSAASIVFDEPPAYSSQEGEGGEEGATTTHACPPAAAPPTKGGEGGEGEDTSLPPLPPSARPAEPLAEPAAPAQERRAVGEVFTPAPAENPVLTALKEHQLYRSTSSPGTHLVVCPWTHEHTREGLGLATYSEPDAAHRHGAFHCPHPHGGRPGINKLLAELDIEPAAASGKAIIRVIAGELHRVVDGAEQVLLARGNLYQHGNQLVRVRVHPENGDITTEPLNEGSVTKMLSAGARWLRWDGQKKEFVSSDPQQRHVMMVLKAQEYRHLPILRGLARQPYLLADGSVVRQAGYDPATRTFGAFEPLDFPLPEPTEAAAREALAALKALVAEFHFRDENDRSAALCAMLTAAMRSQLPLAPAFNISASTSGSGKSLLAGVVALFAGPGQPMNVSYPVRAEEAGKAILTMLMQQPAVVLFDDMQTNWIPHGIINRMLTSETVSDRKLGGNESVKVSTATLVMGTGNNVEPEKDMRRRVVSIYLSPLADTPATLKYKGAPLEEVRGHRGLYVAHALTIVRAWLAVGRPKADVAPIASFGTWSDLCRQPLLWLGEPDPAASIIAQVESDPDADLLATLLQAWHREFGLQAAMLRTVVGRAEADTDGDLWQSMLDMPFMDARGINRNRFGHYLRKNVNRVAAGLQIVKADNSERNAWAVVPAGRQPDGYEPNAARSGFSPYRKRTVVEEADPRDEIF